jgi:hypothetical protein
MLRLKGILLLLGSEMTSHRNENAMKCESTEVLETKGWV